MLSCSPFHSYILSLNNDKINNMFTADERREIEEASSKNELLRALPKPLGDILMELSGKVNKIVIVLYYFTNFPC